MNKQCKSCGTNVPVDVNYCQVCGGSEFYVNNSAYNQYNQQTSVNQTWQPSVAQKQTKKNTWIIVVIVVAILIVLATMGFIFEKVFQRLGYGDNSSDRDEYTLDMSEDINDSSEEIPDKLYYSKGTFDGEIYVNKWADIQLALPEGFFNADLATYNSAENSTTECGAYFIANDTMSLISIIYEKLPTFPIYEEKEYLDAVMKQLNSVTGITYKTPEEYSTTIIGGYRYAKAECEFNNGNGDFSNTIYARKLDDYMICISVMGINSKSNDALVSNITTAK
ncbi:MAG: hypothetical protein E7287_00425 [Lachnospiraceae bacterium]|nr:hypothetical protein [Lachnospiraceae bacterium]